MDLKELKRKYSGGVVPQWELDKLEAPAGAAEPDKPKRGRPRKEKGDATNVQD